MLLAALGVHACLAGAVTWRTGGLAGYAFRSLDAGEYHALARNLAQHGVFSQSPESPRKPDTWRTPGYPAFLAVWIATLGASVTLLILVQQVVSVLNVWLLYRIARGSMDSRRAAGVAALFLLEPYHLYYSLWLMSTTLFITLVLLTWLCWTGLRTRGGLARHVALGLLTGSLVLVRPAGLLIPFVLLVGTMWLAMGRGKSRNGAESVVRRYRGPVALAVTCSLIVGGWMLRNQVVAGRFSLSHQSGIVLAYFKAAEVELWRQGRASDRYLETSLDPSKADAPHAVWDGMDQRLRAAFPNLNDERRRTLHWSRIAQGNQTDVDSFEVSAALSRIGWNYLKRAPLATVGCGLTRCGSVLTFPLNLALSPPNGVESVRLRWLLKSLPYAALCGLVVLRLARYGGKGATLFFPLACTVALLLATTPQVDPRFRVPMIPLLVFVALLPSHTGSVDEERDHRQAVA